MSSATAIATPVFERHFTVQEVADAWHLDHDTIRKIFQDRDDVLKIGRLTSRGKTRSYVSLRIPASVLERVYLERTRGAK